MAAAEPAAPLLQATGLERAYGRQRALRGVNLSLGAGEVLAVVGPNGAGKSTLLRILGGLLRPSAGEVRVLGARIQGNYPDARRPIGVLSHQSLLYDDLTVHENLLFAARLYGLPFPKEAARRASERLGLAGRADERPRRLSRGLQQRAAIARAIVHEPQLLLLDEPFTGLDAVAAEQLRELLAAERSAGRALVIVTHQVAEAWELVTRVGVLVNGRWAFEGPRPAELAGFLVRYGEWARG